MSKWLETRGSHDWCVWLIAESHAVWINIPSFHITSYVRQSNRTCCPLSSTHWGSFEKQLMNGMWMRRWEKRRQKYSQMCAWHWDDSKPIWHVLIIYNYIRKTTFNNHIYSVKTLSSTSKRRASLRLSSLSNVAVRPNSSRNEGSTGTKWGIRSLFCTLCFHSIWRTVKIQQMSGEFSHKAKQQYRLDVMTTCRGGKEVWKLQSACLRSNYDLLSVYGPLFLL